MYMDIKIFICFQMSDTAEEWPEWKYLCVECHRAALYSDCLYLQMIIKEHVIFIDKNGETWVRCMCDRRFHLSCTTN